MPGRPKNLIVRVTDTDLNALDAAVAAAGYTGRSEFVRDMIHGRTSITACIERVRSQAAAALIARHTEPVAQAVADCHAAGFRALAATPKARTTPTVKLVRLGWEDPEEAAEEGRDAATPERAPERAPRAAPERAPGPPPDMPRRPPAGAPFRAPGGGDGGEPW